MRYKVFGSGGLRVSEVALGTGTFGTKLDSGADRQQSKRIFDAFVKAGGNLFDCADAYQGGEAETLLGDFISCDRDSFAVATKYTTGMLSGSLLKTGNSRRAMTRSLEQSLKRLCTEYVDIFWVHFPDHLTPVEEILHGFDDIVRAGKAHYVGFSDFPAWRVSAAKVMADLRGWTPVSGLQIEYSLAERTAERELIPMAGAAGLATMVWSPLGGGVLTGKYQRGEKGRRESGSGAGVVREMASERARDILSAVQAIATELGVSMAQVALAWVKARGAATGTSMIPILGARTVKQLDDNLGAISLTLSEEQMERLDRASAIALGFPHEFVQSEGLLETQSAGLWSQIDRPRGGVM
jgi:aryl-alcohol dehydrogenase-like predicted oxidoreductase